MKITAAVLRAPNQPFAIETLELDDELAPGDVRVKIVATGLCHTDLAVRDQHLPVPLPAVLGHEGAGVVEAVGAGVRRVAVGDHVVLAQANCARCERCVSGHPAYCDHQQALNIPGPRANGTFTMRDGRGTPIGGFFFGQSSFATHALARETSVVKVPSDLPLELLGPLGCGLQTGAGAVLNVLRPGAGSSLAVFGVGPVGLAAVMAARASGCTTIVAVDVHDSRLALARRLGATDVVNSRTGSPSEIVTRIRPRGLDFAVDTTARSDVVHQALLSLRAQGRCALLGIAATQKLEVDHAAMFNGRTLEQVVAGDAIADLLIPRLLELHRAGQFPFDQLVSFYDLADLQKAVADFEAGSVLKAVVRMPQ